MEQALVYISYKTHGSDLMVTCFKVLYILNVTEMS
jgi:hypothetical protein